jgi:hypothetical protein
VEPERREKGLRQTRRSSRWNLNPKHRQEKLAFEKSVKFNFYLPCVLNSGGVFIVIAAGIVMACFALAFEFWWYKAKRPDPITLSDSRERLRSHPKLAGIPSTSAVPTSDILPHGIRCTFLRMSLQFKGLIRDFFILRSRLANMGPSNPWS